MDFSIFGKVIADIVSFIANFATIHGWLSPKKDTAKIAVTQNNVSIGRDQIVGETVTVDNSVHNHISIPPEILDRLEKKDMEIGRKEQLIAELQKKLEETATKVKERAPQALASFEKGNYEAAQSHLFEPPGECLFLFREIPASN